MSKNITLGVIPARMGSSRFPGKPLELIDGKPMIWHIWRRSRLSGLDDVVIATCDQEILDAAEAFGAQAIMTSDKHTRCNDRVAEAARAFPHEIVLNIQGDEPLVHPQLIDDILALFRERPEVQCVNPIAELTDPKELESPNTVKVVYNLDGRVLYFSRYPIPSDWVNKRQGAVYRQVPILGFRRDFFFKLSSLPESPLEIQEGVDMMRAVENNMPVDILKTPYQTIGVDVPEDVRRVEQALADDPIYPRYRETTERNV
ncbi:MAG: 3-deoxy-manno-octulosonate cytidylyltransferase [Elusimicrobiota bacterium]